MERNQPHLDEIFSPRGIAVVGASVMADPVMGMDSFPNQSINALKRAGFPAIYPVNPKYTEVLGLPCYPNLQSIPGVVDHVIVSISAEATLALLDDCAVKGVKSVQIFTAGFSETGDLKRAELEKEMLRKAREGGFRIIGPNCIGILAPKNRLITRNPMPLEPGPIAFLSQSGGYADEIPMFGSSRGLRFSKVISYGNALDVNESEILDFFARDPDTEIIAAYIEGVRDGRHFINALREATARKPVVIQKGGKTKSGQRAAFSHTASLTSSSEVFNALCRQMHTIQVDDMEELIDTMVALRFTRPLPRGNGVAIVGTGGGPSVLASDEMEKAGLQLPSLPSEVQTKLKQFLSTVGSILVNPLDARELTSPEAIYKTLSLVGNLPDIHTLIYHMGFHPVSRWGKGQLASPAYLQAMIDMFRQVQKQTGKPVMLTLSPALDLAGMKDFLAAQEAFVQAQFPVFHSLRGVAQSVARLISWKQA